MQMWNGASLHLIEAVSVADDRAKSVELTEPFGAQKIQFRAPDARHGAARFDVLHARSWFCFSAPAP